MRCAESQRQAIVAAVLYDHFRFVAGTCLDTRADGICLSAVVSRCLVQNIIATLIFTFLKSAIFLFKLRRRKRLVLITTEQYLRRATINVILSAERKRSVMTSWVHQALILFLVLNRAVL